MTKGVDKFSEEFAEEIRPALSFLNGRLFLTCLCGEIVELVFVLLEEAGDLYRGQCVQCGQAHSVLL